MSRDRWNTPLNAAVTGEFLAARLQMRRGQSRRGQSGCETAWLLVAALACGACVREHPAGVPLPGLGCLDGICMPEEIDRRQSTQLLVPGCGEPVAGGPFRVGIAAQRMTLTADGRNVMFSGPAAWTMDGAEAGGAGIALATFDASAGCPDLQLLNDPEHPGASNGAHLAGPAGTFYALVGPAAGTVQVLAQSGVGWSSLDFQTPAGVPVDAPNWKMPNAVAARLDGGGAVVVRSAASGDDPKPSVPSLIEWLDGFPDAPARSFETWIEPSTQAQAAIVSTLGHVRLFPGLDAGSRAAGGFLLIGDSGPPLLFSRRDDGGDGQLRRLDERSAQDASANQGAAMVLLPLRSSEHGYQEGSVLCIGGGKQLDPAVPSNLDILDPAAGSWTTVGSLPHAWTFGTATLLPDGHILVAGGNAPDLRLF